VETLKKIRELDLFPSRFWTAHSFTTNQPKKKCSSLTCPERLRLTASDRRHTESAAPAYDKALEVLCANVCCGSAALASVRWSKRACTPCGGASVRAHSRRPAAALTVCGFGQCRCRCMHIPSRACVCIVRVGVRLRRLNTHACDCARYGSLRVCACTCARVCAGVGGDLSERCLCRDT
jgi:hypothetical protein